MHFRGLRHLLPRVLPIGFAAIAAGGGCGHGGQSQSDAGAGDAAPPGKQVVVLFTSDEHSHLFAFSPELDDFPMATTGGTGTLVGGIARRVAVIAKERAAATAAKKDSILVSGGDNQMGGLSHVAFQTDSIDYTNMKTLAYDVTTFGNHEFDFGPAALAKAIGVAQTRGGLPPIVASNIHFSMTSTADDTLQALYSSDVTDDHPVHPYRVVTTASGVKVGVLGYVGVSASEDAPNKTPVAFSEVTLPAADQDNQAMVLPKLYADIQPVVDQLRNVEKVDLVVALAHGGVPDTSTQAAIQTSDDWNICKNVTGIDLIVSGHAHNTDPKPILVTNTANKSCLVLNGSCFGQHVGRVEFTIPGGGKPVTWDKSTQTLIPVNDTTVPDATEAKAVTGIVSEIEAAKVGTASSSYLEDLLGLVTGKAVTDDPTKPGSLYFYPIGKTTFDISDTRSMTFLSADSMMAASDAWASETTGPTTDVAVESAGVIRAVINQGKTGTIAAADAFNVVPLGTSLTGDGSIGYPLIRAYLYSIELRGVFEFSLANQAAGSTDSDFDLGMGAAQVKYDATRPFATTEVELLDSSKGQVMSIAIASDHTNLENFDNVIYQRAVPTATPPVPGIGMDTDLFSVVTSSYIGQFAGTAGVTLKDATGTPLGSTTTAAVEAAVLHRSDSSEIKQIEGFFQWIYAAPTLPAFYNVKSSQATQRWVCIKGC
jgi:5'-nucleotidase / UDP-sugar diphosphatase